MRKKYPLQVGVLGFIILTAILVGATLTRAQDITGFHNGYLTFTNENPALYYRVEFKPNLTGPEEWDGTFRGLRNFQSSEPEVTIPVGVFYRVAGRDTPWVAGTALATDILSGKTAYVNDEEVTGTMPDRTGRVAAQGSTVKDTTLQFRPQSGYYDGAANNSVDLSDSDFTTSNIKAGVNIFGISGAVIEAVGDAKDEFVLEGATFSRSGEAGLTGTMANRTGHVTAQGSSFDKSTLRFRPQAGYYPGREDNSVQVTDENFMPGNIKAGVSIFGMEGEVVEATGIAPASHVLSGSTFSRSGEAGLTGTMPNRGAVNITPGTTAQTIQQGYHAGAGSVAGDADLVEGNIKSGVSIFGVNGTLSTALIPKTGQTVQELAGDDGDYQKGAAWPNPRFTVGTTDASTNCVTDHLTGLMWVRTPDLTLRSWTNAVMYCEWLNGAEGRGGFTDWRLPNVRELQSLTDFGQVVPAVSVGHPFSNIVFASYLWSSTSMATYPEYAWYVNMRLGKTDLIEKIHEIYIWPVRGGQ